MSIEADLKQLQDFRLDSKNLFDSHPLSHFPLADQVIEIINF